MLSEFRKELIKETIRMSREIRRRKKYIKKGFQVETNQNRINWLYHHMRVNQCLLCIHNSILDVF